MFHRWFSSGNARKVANYNQPFEMRPMKRIRDYELNIRTYFVCLECAKKATAVAKAFTK